jgi:ABC-type glycerol-3-phosphate transport system substrate-binding protein
MTAAAATFPLIRIAGAQTPQNSDFTREASIVSWGFGAEETNPMAFGRINGFNAAYPNIKLELVPDFDDQKLLTAYAAKQLPDLLWMGRDKIATWVSKGVLAPLDDMFANSGIDTSQFYPSAWADVQVDGKVYGLPQFINARALYVNNAAFQEISQDPAQLDTSNWDSLSDLGAKLVKKNGSSIERWGFDHKIQAGWLWLWSMGNGGSMMSEDGKEVTFTDEKTVDALDWGVKAYDAQGGYQQYSSVATTWQGDEQFARGQVAMTMYESWMLGIIARVTPDMDFTVVPIKQRGGSGNVSYTDGSAWCIPNGAKDPEAAWEFIKYMAKPETWMLGAEAVKKARQEANAPYIPSLSADKQVDQMQIDQFYESLGGPFDAAVKLWPQLLQDAASLPTTKSPVGNQIADALQNDAVLPALSGDKSAADALKDAEQAAQDAIESQ